MSSVESQKLSLSGKSILVVDDEVDLRDILSEELEVLGAKTFRAENLKEAREIWDREFVDAIISDVRMPGGSGVDLLRYVQQSGRTQNPVVLLLTGFADLTEEEALGLGAQRLISKPFSFKSLRETICSLLSPPVATS